MHFVSKIDLASARTPQLYEPKSSGFRRATYVDRSMGSVHMGTGICYLDPQGTISPHVHSFEESFYILEGSLIVQIGEGTHELKPGNFALIGTGTPHSWLNIGDRPASWLEMQAPQPRPSDAPAGHDTFFIEGNIPQQGTHLASDSLLVDY